MTTALLCITFYILGASSFGVLALLIIAHRRPPSITKNAHRESKPFVGVLTLAGIEQLHPDNLRRRNRDALPRTLREPPPMPESKVARDAEVGGINYQCINITGEER